MQMTVTVLTEMIAMISMQAAELPWIQTANLHCIRRDL